MSQFRFDHTFLRNAREDLSVVDKAQAEKILWWESMLRGSLQGMYAELAEVIWNIEEAEFDWSSVDQEGWLLDKQTKVEVQAYRRGAVAVASLIERAMCESLGGMQTHSIVEGIDERTNLETRIRDLLAGAAPPSQDGAATRQEPDDQLPSGEVD